MVAAVAGALVTAVVGGLVVGAVAAVVAAVVRVEVGLRGRLRLGEGLVVPLARVVDGVGAPEVGPGVVGTAGVLTPTEGTVPGADGLPAPRSSATATIATASSASAAATQPR